MIFFQGVAGARGDCRFGRLPDDGHEDQRPARRRPREVTSDPLASLRKICRSSRVFYCSTCGGMNDDSNAPREKKGRGGSLPRLTWPFDSYNTRSGKGSKTGDRHPEVTSSKAVIALLDLHDARAKRFRCFLRLKVVTNTSD